MDWSFFHNLGSRCKIRIDFFGYSICIINRIYFVSYLSYLVCDLKKSLRRFQVITNLINFRLAFRNISSKQSSLPSMSSTRRLVYQGIIYRFKFLLIATFVCASATVVAYLMGQVIYLFFNCYPIVNLSVLL